MGDVNLSNSREANCPHNPDLGNIIGTTTTVVEYSVKEHRNFGRVGDNPGYCGCQCHRRFCLFEQGARISWLETQRSMGHGGLICPIGASEAPNAPLIERIPIAVLRVLQRVRSVSLPNPTVSKQERDNIIRVRYEAGETQADLAREFGISYQRVHQIVHDE